MSTSSATQQYVETAVTYLRQAAEAAERARADLDRDSEASKDVQAVLSACDAAVTTGLRAAKRVALETLKLEEARLTALRQQAEAELSKL